MKKNSIIKLLVLIFVLVPIVLSHIAPIYPHHKTIILRPEPGFGTGIDWGYYFPAGQEPLVGFLKDGSFYVSSSIRNKVLRFNPRGELLAEFGQPGQGPGDLTRPDDISILDDRYVVVKESGMTRRISIFDLEGNFIQLIQANAPIFSCLALGGGKIALVTGDLLQTTRKDSIEIRDIHSRKTIPVDSFQYNYSPRDRIQLPRLLPAVHLARIEKDKLLVGFSGSPEISIYSTEGRKLGHVSLDLPQRKISKNEIKKLLNKLADSERNENRKNRLKLEIQKYFDTLTWPDFYPSYFRIAVDARDRILVFGFDSELDDSPVVIHTYSKTGTFLGRTTIDEGRYHPVYPKNFHENWFYTILREKQGDESIVFSRVSMRFE